MATNVNLPEGFVLDDQASLPEGFVLDSAPEEIQQPATSPITESAKEAMYPEVIKDTAKSAVWSALAPLGVGLKGKQAQGVGQGGVQGLTLGYGMPLLRKATGTTTEEIPEPSIKEELIGNALSLPVAGTGAAKLIGKAGKAAKFAPALLGYAYNPSNTEIEPTISGTRAVGAALGTAGQAVGAGAKAISKLGNGAVKKVIKKAGLPAVLESIETGRPLFETGGYKTEGLAKTAQLGSEKAEEKLVPYARSVMENQPQKLKSAIDKTMGGMSSFNNEKQILEHYAEEAKPIYEKAYSYGDLAPKEIVEPKVIPGSVYFGESGPVIQPENIIPGTAADPLFNEKSKLADLVNKDQFLKKYIQDTRKSILGRGLEKFPDTDIRVLDAVKRNIDDDIAKYAKNEQKEKLRDAMKLKKDLVNRIDPIVPEYAEARMISSDAFHIVDAQNTAARIARNESTERIADVLAGYTPAEKDAFVVGLRDELNKQIGQISKTGNRNVAAHVFGTTENYGVRQKLKEVLGESKYNELMKDINPLVKSGQNMSQLLGGSQTTEKEIKIPTKLSNALLMTLRSLEDRIPMSKYSRVADLLMDSGELGKDYSAYSNKMKFLDSIPVKEIQTASGIAGGQLAAVIQRLMKK